MFQTGNIVSIKELPMKSTRTFRVSLWKVIYSGLLTLLVATAVCSSARAATFAYVSLSSGSVAVINTKTNTVVTTIPVGKTGLSNIAATPDGTRVYATSPLDNAVYVVNTVSNAVIGNVPVSVPAAIGITPDGTRAYVTSRVYSGVVSVIDTFSNTVVATISVPDLSYWVAFTPDGNKLFVVANNAPGSVYVIDTNPNSPTYNKILATIPAGTYPGGVGITPNGKFAYVGNGVSADLLVIDTSTYSIVTTIPIPNGASVPAVSASRVYVPEYFAPAVAVVNALTNKVITTITVGPSPVVAAFTPSRANVYVANGGTNTVSVIATATNTVVATITVASGPSDIAMARPCGCR
jgi:YVTN family beta-propeller protein